ncbi:hypothetical protein ABZ070_32930 [Streptomyces sp. NPDC006283]
MTTTDPAQWEDLFVRDVDEQPVQFGPRTESVNTLVYHYVTG